MLLIDAANVLGARPTGWWRDRAGATARLVERVRAAVASSRLPQPVVMVVEGAARGGAPEGEVGGVRVVHAPGHGDDTVAALAAAAAAGPEPEPVTVVSADRALGARCQAAGSRVVGPGWLLERLPADP